MIKVKGGILLKSTVSMRALVTVNADIAAARLIIMNRNTCEVYRNFKLASPIYTLVVPYSHTLGNTLLVGILDDNAVYDCKFTDGIGVENINVNAI